MHRYVNADINMHMLHKDPQNRTRRADIASRAAMTAPVYTCIFNTIYRIIYNISLYKVICIYGIIYIQYITYAYIHIYV